MSAPPAPTTATILVTCPDRRGIVAALAQVLHGHGANILDSDQHSDLPAKKFFQRIRFDAAELVTDRLTLERALGEVADRFGMTWRIAWEGVRKRLAIFVSKYDHCLWDLLLRHRAGELVCDIPLIVSNHEALRPIAAHFGIRFEHFPITKETKRAQEQRELALLREVRADLVVLARYMQVLSGELLDGMPCRVINIHHSFLPAFMGGRPYHQAFERGVKLVGATAHYATNELDEGPIIHQGVVACSHRDSIDDLVRKGRDLERSVLAHAVRCHIEDRIAVYDNKTVVFA
jgi:formyltetrahydrofolate deformylase